MVTLIFLRDLCGYFGVNIFTLSPLRGQGNEYTFLMFTVFIVVYVGVSGSHLMAYIIGSGINTDCLMLVSRFEF